MSLWIMKLKMLIELIDFNKKFKKIFTHKVDKNNIDKLELRKF